MRSPHRPGGALFWENDMSSNIDHEHFLINVYPDFVRSVTSEQSRDFSAFLGAVVELHNVSRVNVPALLTGSMGLSGESGEVIDIVKKLVFHGDPWKKHENKLKKEVGDCLWYIQQLCVALEIDMLQAMQENIAKLSARHSAGSFSNQYDSSAEDNEAEIGNG